MVGIFSRFSASRAGHRRAQSALVETTPTSEATAATTMAAAALGVPHGVEVAIEFKPVERPTEPLDSDQPVQCPLAEPSILNDGRIWKERVSSSVQRRTDLPVMQEPPPTESETPTTKSRAKRLILPSISAPEHNILKLLEECNASGV
ncbi:uncharacterized protein [Henckelia pumila]|uniref:uncharacterized protein n=1 Tax=Henckelia pumila TaxID=405737 RepID=UPI003C6DD9E9